MQHALLVTETSSDRTLNFSICHLQWKHSMKFADDSCSCLVVVVVVVVAVVVVVVVFIAFQLSNIFRTKKMKKHFAETRRFQNAIYIEIHNSRAIEWKSADILQRNADAYCHKRQTKLSHHHHILQAQLRLVNNWHNDYAMAFG